MGLSELIKYLEKNGCGEEYCRRQNDKMMVVERVQLLIIDYLIEYNTYPGINEQTKIRKRLTLDSKYRTSAIRLQNK